MAQNIYILTDIKTKSLADRICKQIVVNGIYESEELVLSESILTEMAKDCKVEYFYVVVTSKEILFTESALNFKPPQWDHAYVHIWNNDPAVRLFNVKMVLENPGAYTDEMLDQGKIKLKQLNKTMFEYPIFDIIFLSYDEFWADDNFKKLTTRFPKAKRVAGVKGIHEAHKAAAKISSTSMFYVVDADAEIVPGFNFYRQTEHFDINTVYVWHSRNPVNGLEYGYGGIKLFPTCTVLDYNESDVDFTTSITKNVMVMKEVANVTRFDTDPFSAWRSAFRECVKLSTGIINRQQTEETEERLRTWCTVGNGEFGDFAVIGANEGREFGTTYSNQPEMLRLINDFNWLEKKFNT
jgi:hypothetical protein